MVGSALGVSGIMQSVLQNSGVACAATNNQQANAAFQAASQLAQGLANSTYGQVQKRALYYMLCVHLPDCEFGYEHAMYLSGGDREDLNKVIVSLYTKMSDLTKQYWALMNDGSYVISTDGWEMFVSFKDPGDYMQIDLIHNSENVKIERILPPESI